MSLLIDNHRQYLEDEPRVAAFARAIAEVVRPGDVVADVASGTGILGLLACRAGAARVYAIDDGGIVGIARAIAIANGYADRIVQVRGHSSRVTLPERVDVAVSDQVGRFGFDNDVVELCADVRRRMLKPGARQIPTSVASWVAPIEHADLYAMIDFWKAPVAGFDFSSVREAAANTGYPQHFERSEFLGAGAEAVRFDLTDGSLDAAARGQVRVTIERAGVMHGLAGWFVAALSASARLTNAPGAPDRIARRQVFFPIAAPVAVAPGDIADITIAARPDGPIVAWTVIVERAGREIARSMQSTLRGMLLIREDLRATDTGSRPQLNRWAHARLTVLELCDGRRLLRDIEREVGTRHADLFPAPADAARFVAEVVTRYGEIG